MLFSSSKKPTHNTNKANTIPYFVRSRAQINDNTVLIASNFSSHKSSGYSSKKKGDERNHLLKLLHLGFLFVIRLETWIHIIEWWHKVLLDCPNGSPSQKIKY